MARNSQVTVVFVCCILDNIPVIDDVAGGAIKVKARYAQKKVAMSVMQQALGWSNEGEEGEDEASMGGGGGGGGGKGSNSNLRIVVLQNLFVPADFSSPSFSDELEEDLASECSRSGVVDKITVFSNNPCGVAVVKFTATFAAKDCVQRLDKRFFGGRQLRCFYWDGVTDYTVHAESAEGEKEEEERLDEFGDWLEKGQEELPDEFKIAVEK